MLCTTQIHLKIAYASVDFNSVLLFKDEMTVATVPAIGCRARRRVG